MSKISERFKSVTVLMAGLPALLPVAEHFLNDGQIPGLHYLGPLGMLVICAWAGMLLREVTGRPKPWVSCLAWGAVLFSVHMACRVWQDWWHATPYLYLISIATGHLIPSERKDGASIKDGWGYLALLVAATLSYVAVSAAGQYFGTVECSKGSLRLFASSLREILAPAEVLLGPLVVYFAARFSLSGAGQWLGKRKPLGWIAGTALAMLFLATLRNLFISPRFWFRGELAFIIRFLVQPVTIWLAAVLTRVCRRLFKKGNAPWSWKEIIEI